MSIRSGKGDDGFTDLSFHKRVSKDSSEVCTMGDLDELSAYIGIVKSKTRSKKNKTTFETIQHALSIIASEVAISGAKKKELGHILKKEDADWIMAIACELERKTKIESSFAIPGSGELSAFLDVARTVARRAERSVVKLFQEEKLKNVNILTYMNCISDILFIMARKKTKVTRKTKRKTKRKFKRKS